MDIENEWHLPKPRTELFFVTCIAAYCVPANQLKGLSIIFFFWICFFFGCVFEPFDKKNKKGFWMCQLFWVCWNCNFRSTLLEACLLSSLLHLAYLIVQEKSRTFDGPRSSAFAARHHRQIAVLDLYCAHIETSLFYYLSHTDVRSWNTNGLIPFFLSCYKCFNQNNRNISKKATTNDRKCSSSSSSSGSGNKSNNQAK